MNDTNQRDPEKKGGKAQKYGKVPF